jgi:predicted ester cyclase
MRTGHLSTTLLWSVILATSAGCQGQPPHTSEASTEGNKALVRRWIEEGFNQSGLNVVDELFAERVRINGQIVGRDGLKQNMSRHLRGFPDLHVTIDDIVAEGRTVGIWYTTEGTHRGEFEAIPPTGNRVKWVGADLFGIDGGKISEARFLSDFHGLLIQLGATVSLSRPPEHARP